jgi:hypothetical protein
MPTSVQIPDEDVHNHPGVVQIPDADVHNPPNTVPLQEADLDQLPADLRTAADSATWKTPDPDSAADIRMNTTTAGGGREVAEQEDPNTVLVNDNKNLAPNAEDTAAGTIAHEATHLLMANQPPTEMKSRNNDARTKGTSVYDISDADSLRAQGKTIGQIPEEKAASIVEAYEKTKAKNLKPWVDDLKNLKQSTVLPTTPKTNPNADTINTTARAPRGGQQMLEDLPKGTHVPTQASGPLTKKSKWNYNAASALGGGRQ